MTGDLKVGGADHQPRLVSGCRVDDVGIDRAQHVGATPVRVTHRHRDLTVAVPIEQWPDTSVSSAMNPSSDAVAATIILAIP